MAVRVLRLVPEVELQQPLRRRGALEAAVGPLFLREVAGLGEGGEVNRFKDVHIQIKQ